MTGKCTSFLINLLSFLVNETHSKKSRSTSTRLGTSLFIINIGLYAKSVSKVIFLGREFVDFNFLWGGHDKDCREESLDTEDSLETL